MAAPMVIARLQTFRNLMLPLTQAQTYSKQVANNKQSKFRKRYEAGVKPKPYTPVTGKRNDILRHGPKTGSFSLDTTKGRLQQQHKGTGIAINKQSKPKERHEAGIKPKLSTPMTDERNDILRHVNFDRPKTESSSLDTTKDRLQEQHEDTGIVYTLIKQENDKRLGDEMIKAKLKKYQMKEQKIVLEGKPLIQDALEAGLSPLRLYFVNTEALQGLTPEMLQDTEVYKVRQRQLRLWTATNRKCDIVGIFEKPECGKDYIPRRSTIPVTLVCDHIREGLSLGTLISSAAAVGCKNVIVMKGCINVWDPKTLQAGVGCHFRIPITSDVTWSSLPEHLPEASSTVYSVGPIADTERPVSHNTDTVDVLEEIHKVEQEEMLGAPSVADGSDSDSDSESDEESDLETDTYEEYVPDVYRYIPIFVQSYDSVDYSKGHSVVLVSGDPSGVSLPACKFVHDAFGQGVEVPVSGDVPRLSIALQGSIMLFQIAAQFRKLNPSPAE